MAARRAGSDEPIWLAWAGWQMRIAPDWRPWTIAGGLERGAMMIGDAGVPLMRVKWSRPGRPFDPVRWLGKRLGRGPGGANGQPAPGAPRSADLQTLAWLPEGKAPKGGRQSAWYGWSQAAGLLIEVVAGWREERRPLEPAALRRAVSSLRVGRTDGPVGWAVFEVSFRGPPGFDVTGRKFLPGHMSLLLSGPTGERLLLRQVYPAELALGKKDLAAWMRAGPFAERRRFYPAGEAEAWSVDSFGRRLDGLIRRGRKRLPAPLGWAASRWTVAAAVRDAEMDRLLLVEMDSPRPIGDEVVTDAMAAMNWAIWESQGGA